MSTTPRPGPDNPAASPAVEVDSEHRMVWAEAAMATFTRTAAMVDERVPDLPYADRAALLVASLCHALAEDDSPADVLARGFHDYNRQHQDEHPGDLEFGFAGAAGKLIGAVLSRADADSSAVEAISALMH